MVSCCGLFGSAPEVIERTRLSPVSQSVSREQQRAIEAIFANKKEAVRREFNEIETPKSGPRILFVPQYSFCIDNSMILSKAPTDVGSLDSFLTCIYEDADAVFNLMQDLEPRQEFDRNPLRYLDDDADLSEKFHVKRTVVGDGPLCLHSTLELTPKSGCWGKTKRIPHFHYRYWVDGDRADCAHLAALARKAMQAARPLLHCYGGTGRTGTLAAIILAYQKIKAGDHAPDVIQRAVEELREERPDCVHNLRQYICVYNVVHTLLHQEGVFI